MKKNIRLLLAAILALSISFTSCKKTDRNSNNSDLATHADDQSNVASASDDIANDANDIIDNYGAFNGRPNGNNESSFLHLPCNADIGIDSTPTTRTLTVTYHGLNCIGNRNRTGIVTISIPLNQHWGDQGAVLTIEATDLHITRVVDNKSITINGVSTITNVTGGRIGNLSSQQTIIHDIASQGITVTFDNGSQRSWQIAKRRTFTYDNGIVISTVGTHTDGNVNNISEWGINRFGNAFVTSITAPMVIREDCSFRLVSGQVTNERLVANVVATFGLDASGNPTGCPASGNYYMKIVWTGANGNSGTIIRPY